MKSKRQPDTWKLLEAQYQFFLDRNQGSKIMPELLRRVGLRIICQRDPFPDDQTPDPVWIQHCGKENLIVLTGDKALETDPINRQAVIDCRVKVVLLDENNSRAVEWASAVIVSRRKLVKIIHENDGPFFISLRKTSGDMVWRLRRP